MMPTRVEPEKAAIKRIIDSQVSGCQKPQSKVEAPSGRRPRKALLHMLI